MADNNAPARALSWDEPIIPTDSGFEPIPEGDYAFEVKSFERGWYNGSKSGKVPPCPEAKLTVSLLVGGKHRQLTESLKLADNLQWIITTYFQCCGLWPEVLDEATPRVMDFEATVGATGVCHVTSEEYNDKTYNHVGTWYKPTVGVSKLGAAMAASAAQPTQPAVPAYDFTV